MDPTHHRHMGNHLTIEKAAAGDFWSIAQVLDLPRENESATGSGGAPNSDGKRSTTTNLTPTG